MKEQSELKLIENKNYHCYKCVYFYDKESPCMQKNCLEYADFAAWWTQQGLIINQFKADQKVVDALQSRIKELEETIEQQKIVIPTKEKAENWYKRLKESPIMHGDKQLDLMLYQDIIAKLQKIIDKG